MPRRIVSSPIILWRRLALVFPLLSACGDSMSATTGTSGVDASSGGDASATTGTSDVNETSASTDVSTGSGASTGTGSSTTSTPETAGTSGVDEACGYGLGPGGLTFSLQIDDPLAHLLTDPERPDTGEVYCLPAVPGNSRAIVMVPGLGLSHYLYLTTPDRRDGWAPRFAAAGVSAHVLNPARNKSTAADPAPADNWSIWDEVDFWPTWGFGPMAPEPYPEVRFPIGDVDDFEQHLPYFGPGPGGMSVSQAAIDELTELLEQVGPAALMLHSAAGGAGFEVARARPELVKALVVVEPTACPTEPELVPPLPFLAVYGDYIAQRGQSGRFANCQMTRDLVEQAGFVADFYSYPGVNVFGNTHVLMQDDNSAEIHADVLAWLEDNAL